MRLLPRLKIAQKLPIVVAGAALVASAVVGVGAYLIAANTVTAMTADKLVTVAAGRSRALEDRLAAIRTDLQATAISANTTSALANMEMNWPSIGADPAAIVRDAFITNNPNPADQRDALDFAKLKTGISYDSAHQKLHGGMRSQMRANGYEDIYLFDSTGMLIYSVMKGDEFATSFVDGPYANSTLGEVYRAAAGGAVDAVAFADVAPYAATPDRPASFMHL